MNKKGQIILALILVMTVALAIGLSVIQKSLVDVSTATKVEQSSRAFSAAEAGIEKALKNSDCGAGGVNCNVAFTENDSSATVSDSNLLPATAPIGTQQGPLEYDSLLGKEDVGHVWLADYTSSANPPTAGYTQSTLDVYWGNSDSDKAAIELSLVYYDGSRYTSKKWYLDHIVVRNPANSFEPVACTKNYSLAGYQCKKVLDFSSITSNPSARLMLIRARLLYNTTSQSFAVQAVGTCGSACSIPPQKRVIISTGASGETQRTVRVFQMQKVVPPYFDYAIFSAGEISK